MKRISFLAGLLLAGTASLASAAGGVVGLSGFEPTGVPSWAGGSGLDSVGSRLSDPPGRIFPGKYFEYKAQFYLHKGDYAEALRLFELAGFWANKRAQYNAGVMYYNGIGVPADRTRGVAWLGIAAENHDDLSDSTLQTTYASLSAGEKAEADQIFRQLDEKYGDSVSIPRALKQFGVETHNIVGSHVGFTGGNVQVAEVGTDDTSYRPGAYFYRKQRDERDALISTVTGHVTVGAVMALPVAPQR